MFSKCILFQQRKPVDTLQTWWGTLSPKVTLFFPLFLPFVFPRHRRAAVSPVATANDRPAADIDRRGRLSLQEANNKAEVKIHPAWQLLHLLVFIQGCALGDPGKKKIYESDGT